MKHYTKQVHVFIYYIIIVGYIIIAERTSVTAKCIFNYIAGRQLVVAFARWSIFL